MIINAKKQNNYIGFLEGFVCSPILATNEKQLVLDLEDELYRTCNWLSKKPPKDVDVFKVKCISVDYGENDVRFFYNGEFFKNEYKDLKAQIVQGYFSLKCMCESVNSGDIDTFTNLLKGLYFDFTKSQVEGGFLEIGFMLIDVFEENYTTNQVEVKAYMYKTLYKIIDFAKEFYNNYKNESKNLTNSFYF